MCKMLNTHSSILLKNFDSLYLVVGKLLFNSESSILRTVCIVIDCLSMNKCSVFAMNKSK